jgi:hypothetical protein
LPLPASPRYIPGQKMHYVREQRDIHLKQERGSEGRFDIQKKFLILIQLQEKGEVKNLPMTGFLVPVIFAVHEHKWYVLLRTTIVQEDGQELELKMSK